MEILTSIYEKYCNRIETTNKNFEFRNFKIVSDKGYFIIWIYVPNPIKEIRYKMTVKNPICEFNSDVQYNEGNEKFIEIMENGRKFAYEIIALEKIEEPIPLANMKKLNVNAPQNFAYIDNYPQLKVELKKARTRKIF
ncbi:MULTISPECIES: hypothetical protein [unclassified Viridibacillus]|uniref:hypothetical protein n=1 Tax=unclassified Viridibacillus TaxID=2617942 RepID=UPI00096F2859|nr:hypothetical protein [Viridibacillus sp. FSL H8-0123]OMC81427.1 hypothetical protein BK130_14860 [Viridibacillus sp. FSL H8-0123]